MHAVAMQVQDVEWQISRRLKAGAIAGKTEAGIRGGSERCGAGVLHRQEDTVDPRIRQGADQARRVRGDGAQAERHRFRRLADMIGQTIRLGELGGLGGGTVDGRHDRHSGQGPPNQGGGAQDFGGETTAGIEPGQTEPVLRGRHDPPGYPASPRASSGSGTSSTP